MKITFKHSLVTKRELSKVKKVLDKETKKLYEASQNGYEDNRASLNLSTDSSMLATVKKIIKEKLALQPSILLIVGIGGSNLGTIAIQEALLGKLYNQLDPHLKVYYVDTVDADKVTPIYALVEKALKKKQKIILNGISKSGGTTETIANFEIFLKLLQRHQRRYKESVVVTTNKDSPYWKLAQKEGYSVLEIPKKVGGRYSVLSPVGLFPLGLLGINISEILKGANHIRILSLKKNNPVSLSAAVKFIHYQKSININDLLLFSTDFESFGKWYRQLMGESLGKEYDIHNKKVFSGMTPTVSIGSTDLHSMAQLYLGGPYDKFTTFISLEKNKQSIKIPNFRIFSSLVSHIQGKKLSEIMKAILIGVMIAYKKGKRPFSSITLETKSAYHIGELLQFHMIEMMYLGVLFGVNPFNQPNVETYKIETKRILAKK